MCHMGIVCHVSLLSQIIKFCTLFFFRCVVSPGWTRLCCVLLVHFSMALQLKFFFCHSNIWERNLNDSQRANERQKERQFTKISWPLKMLNTRAGTTIYADNDDFSCFSCSNYISAYTGKIKWKCKFNDLFRHGRRRRRSRRHCFCRCVQIANSVNVHVLISPHSLSFSFLKFDSINIYLFCIFLFHNSTRTLFQSQFDYCRW